MIRAKIEKALEAGLRGPWRALEETFAGLLEGLPRRSEKAEGLETYLTRIKALLGSVEEAFEAAFDWPERSDAEARCKTTSSENMIPTSLGNETCAFRDIRSLVPATSGQRFRSIRSL